jgi:hypothetical protein
VRAVVVMVAAGWFATATAWAAAPTAAHAAKAQTAAHKNGHVANTAQHKAHRKGVRPSAVHAVKAQATARHVGTRDRVAASSGHAGAPSHAQRTPHTPRQASAHKPAKPAAVRPAPRRKLMVDAPAPSVPAVSVKRTNPPPQELPPILS